MLSDHKTINSIQMLRAIAAIMVVIFHATAYLDVRNHIADVPRMIESGRSGVDLFFIISGFIMVWISHQKFGMPHASRDFIARRIIRIVPIYWFYTLLMAMLALALPHLVSEGKTVTIEHLFASLFFIPWENNIGYIKPVLSPGWTLNFEMYFYLLFGILLFLKQKYFIPLLSGFLVFGIVAGSMVEHIPTVFYVSTSPLLLEFLMGCMIAYGYRHIAKTPLFLVIVLLISAIIALILTGIYPTPSLPRQVKYGIPCAIIITSLIYLENHGKFNANKLLVKLGDSSYSLYLSHLFTISAFGKIWFTVFGGMYVAFVFAASIVSVIVGHIGYLLLEKPITIWLNRKYKTTVSLRQ